MDRRIDQTLARVAADHHGVFAFHHLDALGITKAERHHRVAAGLWLAVHEGVFRIAGAPSTWKAGVVAACWAGGTRAASGGHGMTD